VFVSEQRTPQVAAARPYDIVKRILDVLSAAVLLVVTSPVQLIVAIAVASKLGRPVLFRQARPGLHGRVFTLVKFRSMRDSDPARGLVSDEDRLTRFGRGLRSTSADELPTLVNVLRGDMSMVGPRPLLVSYLGRYTPEQARRHEVRPGVTGLAQVSGRNAIEWDEKLRLDVEYVNARSFRLDASILWRTVTSVLRREGISADGHVTSHEFMGSPEGGERA
jgi:lipopolysaccharide/colanic/teichoic acid biosynthesis glycosyltransferase